MVEVASSAKRASQQRGFRFDRHRARVAASRVATAVTAAMAGAAVLASGCAKRELRPVTPCTTSGVVENIKVNRIDNLDLLFVIDGSRSMVEEINALNQRIPDLVRSLTLGQIDPNDPNSERFPPPRSIHVGMVTVDMGVLGLSGGNVDALCTDTWLPDFSTTQLGEDGVLWNIPNWAYSQCQSYAQPTTSSPRFLVFERPNTEDPAVLQAASDAISDEFACRTALVKQRVGAPDANCSADSFTDGQGRTFCRQYLSCGYEQQLEAMYKSIAPSTVSGFFSGSTPERAFGHGSPDGINKGFVREDSLLAIVVVSDEEDCSAKNAEVFSPAAQSPNIQCVQAAYDDEQNPNDIASAKLTPVQRYVDGLLKLRENDPELLIFSAIVGLPIDADAKELYSDPRRVDFNGLLAHPKMQYADANGQLLTNGQPPGSTLAPAPACELSGVGLAGAGRRYVRVAQALSEADSGAVVYPICTTDFTPAIQGIITLVSDVLNKACLPRPLTTDSQGLVPCDVTLALPAGVQCSSQVGVESTPVRTEGDSQVCRVNQLPHPPGQAPGPCNATSGEGCGWFYDDFTDSLGTICPPTASRPTSQRIAFTSGSEPMRGARVRFECLQSTESAPSEEFAALGRSCTDNSACASLGDGAFCEPSTRTCQIRCQSSANCPPSYACDTSMDDPLCVNPVCGR
jgi:hypothetical protein